MSNGDVETALIFFTFVWGTIERMSLSSNKAEWRGILRCLGKTWWNESGKSASAEEYDTMLRVTCAKLAVAPNLLDEGRCLQSNS